MIIRNKDQLGCVAQKEIEPGSPETRVQIPSHPPTDSKLETGDRAMTHEVETMAWIEKVPWHGLGVKVEKGTNLDDFIKAAGLDWELIPHEIGIREQDGQEFERVDERIVWVRNTDHKRMVFSSPSWTPLQNRAGIYTMNEWIRAGGLVMDTMGSLRGGRTVWALARLEDSFKVSASDHVMGYLLLTMQHQLGQCNSIRKTTVRVVCANTMAMAENEGESNIHYSQNHLQPWNVDKAKEFVESAHSDLAAAGKRAKVLHKMKLSIDDAIDKVLLPVFEPELAADPIAPLIIDAENLPSSLTGILDSVNNAPGAEPGTGWGILNGVTHYADHSAGRSEATRLYNAWYGSMSKKKLEVEKKLLELAS